MTVAAPCSLVPTLPPLHLLLLVILTVTGIVPEVVTAVLLAVVALHLGFVNGGHRALGALQHTLAALGGQGHACLGLHLLQDLLPHVREHA